VVSPGQGLKKLVKARILPIKIFAYRTGFSDAVLKNRLWVEKKRWR
jgi:hypothetical protein